MDYAEPILINLRKEGLMFNLNKNLSYLVFLHDPDFFLVTINPVTMPSTDTTILPEEAGDAYMTLTLQVCLALRAESARAFTGRRCPHSGRGKTF